MKRTISIILTLIFYSSCLTAQNSCKVKSGKAFYYDVISGVNNIILNTNGKVEVDKTSENLNFSIYLITNCVQIPFVVYSTFGKKKLKLEFLRIHLDKDEVGYDTNGKIKGIKAAKGAFLWKANSPMEGKITNVENTKILIKGMIGGKKFNYAISNVEKLQPIAMY